MTHGGFVPVQLQRLLELPASDPRVRSLQSIMCCGSPLPAAVKRGARDALGCDLIELYGLTEGIITTLAPEDFDDHLESVGKPIPGQRIALVGDDDREAGPGAPGEICGHGRLVMEGYHNRPRRPPRRPGSTRRDVAGCARATSAGSMPKASFTSSTARRT